MGSFVPANSKRFSNAYHLPGDLLQLNEKKNLSTHLTVRQCRGQKWRTMRRAHDDQQRGREIRSNYAENVPTTFDRVT